MAIYSAKKARRAIVDTVLFRAVSQVASILGFIVLVRAMPEEDFGIFHLLYAFIPAISIVASLGLEQTLQRYQPEYLSAGNIPAARWLVRFAASARFGSNVILIALILLSWNWVAPFFKLDPYRGEFAFFCLLVLFHFQARILELSLSANMLHRFAVGSMAVLSITKLALYSGFAWFGELTLPTAILTETIAFALAYCLMAITYRKLCPAPAGPRFTPPAAQRKRLLRYALFNNFNDAGAVMLGHKSDNFFLVAFLDPVAVAAYAFYNRLDEMLGRLQPLRIFDNVVRPLFFAVPLAEADEKLPRYFSLLLNTNLLLQLPVLAFAIAYHAELVMMVFGGKFVESSALFPMVVAFTTLNTFATPATLVAQYEERAAIILLSKIFAIYNVVALLVLIPLAGLYGAVIATGSAAFFKNSFIWWFARKRARWLQFAKSVAASVLTWGTTLGACFLAKSATELPVLIDLLVGVTIIGAGALVHLQTPALSASDREILTNVLKGREAQVFELAGLIPRARGPL